MKKFNLLYVDDEESNLRIFKDTFRREFNIFIARTAKEGMKILDENDIDLVLSDQRMPEMTGVEFLAYSLKKNPAPNRILVTGYSDMDAIENAINQARIFQYIQKPWDRKKLLRVIKNALRLYQVEQELKKQKEELIRAKNEAERADKLKSIFLAQMSHEIRTPINAMLSLSSLLKSDLEDQIDDDKKISFDLIHRAGMRIIRTIDMLLNLSEIQAGTYEVIMKEFDLYADVLGKVVLNHKKQAANKSIILNVEVQTSDTVLIADIYTVEQILKQLIDNAIKYTDEGEIKIRVFRDEETNLIVEVVDTGIGISEEYIPELFTPFSQEELGYTRKYEGNGIGLTLVKKFCELNNANIELESEKGKGSVFRVVFNCRV